MRKIPDLRPYFAWDFFPYGGGISPISMKLGYIGRTR